MNRSEFHTHVRIAITLGQIRAARPCKSGWVKLLDGLGYVDGKFDPERELTIGDVAFINGAADAMWCLDLIDDVRLRVSAIMPAVERSATFTTDARVHDCIASLRKWLDGDEHVDLAAAAAAAWAAAAAAAAAWAAAAAAWAAMAAAAAAAWAAAAAAWAAMAAAWAAEDVGLELAAGAERAMQVNDLIALFGRGEEKKS